MSVGESSLTAGVTSPATVPAAASGDRLRWIAVLVGVAVLIGQWIRVVQRPTGDFLVHWEFGRRFLAGDFIYAVSAGGDPLGHNHPYPPLWAMVHAPLSLIPIEWAHAVCFPFFVLPFGLLVFVLLRIGREQFGMRTEFLVTALVWAVFLAGRYLLRDMVECGANLTLVAASWAAVWLWTRGQRTASGLLLGLATALKCTPVLFIAYFALKREWKTVSVAVAATVAFSVAPVTVMGVSEYRRASLTWLERITAGVMTSGESGRGVLGPEPIQNMTARPALTRYLSRLPAAHIGRLADPLYLDFLDLDPQTAAVTAMSLLAVLAGFVAWRFRSRADFRSSRQMIWECGLISLAILLYSPITWGQHCVGVLPALFLIQIEVRRGSGFPRWIPAALWIYFAVVVLCNREMIGRRFSLLADAYYLQTWCLFAVGGVLLWFHSKSADADAGGYSGRGGSVAN